MRTLLGLLWAVGLPTAALAAEPPARILDLSCWKLTLPIAGERRGHPREIEPPALASFADRQHFFVTPDARGVAFRAPCGGVATEGSDYPRSELREMEGDGRTPAAWGTDGPIAHVLTLRAAITATPAVKRHVVCAQIHDADDDVMMIRLEGTKLFVERAGLPTVMLERKYVLGTPFSVKLQAGHGRIQVWYDGVLKLDWAVSRTGCYFKAGCYTQSSARRGDSPDSYGEVVIHALKVEHGQQPAM